MRLNWAAAVVLAAMTIGGGCISGSAHDGTGGGTSLSVAPQETSSAGGASQDSGRQMTEAQKQAFEAHEKAQEKRLAQAQKEQAKRLEAAREKYQKSVDERLAALKKKREQSESDNGQMTILDSATTSQLKQEADEGLQKASDFVNSQVP